jgi:hypothetical protein
MDIYQDKIFLIFFIILALVLFLCVLVVIVQYINDFTRELKYLNMEISRSRGAEREHWLRRRRKLWLSIIPFVKY